MVGFVLVGLDLVFCHFGLGISSQILVNVTMSLSKLVRVFRKVDSVSYYLF